MELGKQRIKVVTPSSAHGRNAFTSLDAILFLITKTKATHKKQ
jgi:hypothetical protein